MTTTFLLLYCAGSNRQKTDEDLLRELEVLLSPQVAIAQRCKTLKELCDSEKINRLEDVSRQLLMCKLRSQEEVEFTIRNYL